MAKLTKLQAVQQLREYDHAFLTPEGAKEFAAPFGIVPGLHYEMVDHHNPKGLRIPGKEHGDRVEGIAAHQLAEQLCGAEGLPCPDFYGIGSQLRACCELLEQHLAKQ